MVGEGFPALQPAMTVHVPIDALVEVGSVSKGTPVSVAPLKNIIVKTEPGFSSPTLDAEIVGSTGNNYIHRDPGGKHMRLDAHGVVKDKRTQGLVYVHYTGVVGITPEVSRVLSGHSEAKSTEFGETFIEVHFETGKEELKDLETGVFVGAGRFVVEQDGSVMSEYKLSKLVKGTT